LQAVRKICDQTGTLLILDEIQTGLGRTGRLFAYEHYGFAPDIMTLAKALANGLPMGAMLTTDDVAQAFGPGAHASTFGGTPIVSAAAVEVLRTLTQEGLLEHCAAMGHYFNKRLLELKARHPSVMDVRGRGLLVGIKLNIKGESIVQACLREGFLINCVQENILRFIPPLVIEKQEIDNLLAYLDTVL